MVETTEKQELKDEGKFKYRSLAKPKMRDYILRKYNCKPIDLPRYKRFPFVYLLADHFGFSPKEIGAFFGCATSTAFALRQDARYFHSRHKQQQAEEKAILAYIIYIVRWKAYKLES